MTSESKTVYILGAGCSAGAVPADPGYPLANEFSCVIEEFSKTLVVGNQKRIKSCAVATFRTAATGARANAECFGDNAGLAKLSKMRKRHG